jgi:uncharacterized protein (TIGR02452 family)
MNNIFSQRIDCWNNTIQISHSLPLPSQSTKIIYDPHFTYHKKHPTSNIKIFNIDSIDCCLQYAPDALVLNLADDNFPGGCVAMGSGAQEESLFRRTNYCNSLLIDMYPIKNDQVVYSPGISVIKTNENTGWQLLNTNHLPKISFVACPGIKLPDTIIINNEPQLNTHDAKILERKIKTIIQTAIKYNHDTIIFGALGCGAWKNPVKHVAQIFKKTLHSCDGVILNYYFAILKTNNDNYIVRNHNSNITQNIDVFIDVFNS